jgi:hypothetical protein
MEVGQGPNWDCSAKEKKLSIPIFITKQIRVVVTPQIRAWEAIGSNLGQDTAYPF